MNNEPEAASLRLSERVFALTIVLGAAIVMRGFVHMTTQEVAEILIAVGAFQWTWSRR